MLSDPMVMLTHSAQSAPSPSTATPQLRASTWWRWGTKRSRQNGGHDGGAIDTDSSNSSAASSSVSVTIVVLAALTAATASITYHVYQLLTRSSYQHRSQSAPRCRPRTRHGEVLGSSPESEITMESVDTAAPLSHNAARSGSSTGWRSSSVDGCGSAAAHVVACANPSSAVGSEGELDQGRLREEDVGVRQLSLIPVAGIATDAGALCGNRDMSFGQHSGLSSQLAHGGTAALHDRRTTSATAANPSPPPPATPKVLLSSPYDLESYGLQGLAGGAHGWRRVFGLLKPEPRRRSERDGPFAEDRDAAVAGGPGHRAPRSLTRTYEDSGVTAIEDPALLRESVRAIAQATAAAEIRSPAQSTSTAASMYRSDVVRSDVSVHSSTSRQSVTMAKPHAAQWYSHDRQPSSVTATTAVSTSTNVSTQQSPSPRLILPAAEAPTPPSRFLNSLSFHVLHYLSFCASRSTGNAPGVNTTAGEANSSTAGSGMHTLSTANTYVTSAALAMAQRNLQRDISALVAATASVRPAVSASSTSSASRTHTACCSTMSLVTVSPRAADKAFCKSQLRDQEVAAAEPCLSVVTLHPSSSRSIGQSRNGLIAEEEEEGAAQHAVGSRVLMGEDGQQQGIGRSPHPQGTDVCHEEPDSSWQRDISVTRSGRSQCGVTMLDSAQERKVAPLPSLTTPSGVAAAAAVGAAAECCVSPVLLKEASTEASDAAGTEPTGAPRFPPSTAHRRTIAEQLAVLTGRREQQRLYTQQLLESRRLTRLGSEVEKGLVSPLATPSSPTYADAAGAPTMMDFRSTELSSTSTSGMCGPSSGASQYYTDTAPGVYYSSLLQLYHYESHAYSDITTEVQQWKRQRQWDHIASLGACAPTTPKARVGDEGVVNGAHTTTRMATGVATAKAAASRRSMERSAAETSLTAATEAAAAIKASASAGTAGLTSGVGSVAPLGQSKLASPSNERRVDDLTVKQQEDGSASYFISLTYHDSETGTSRTVKTSALPPLRRCDAAAPPPALSSLSSGPAVRPAPPTTHPAMAAALTSQAAGVTLPTHSRSVSGGAAAHARAAGSALALPEMVTATGKSLLHAQRCRAFNAEDKNAASTALCLAEEARASGERPRLAARSSSSAGGILKCCNSSVPALAAADAASANPPCNTEATATAGRILPFAAPLPPTEPQHGPRLRGVAGRNGEMAIGAFLGGGACGKVYECLNTETGQVLAAKQIVFDAKDRRLRTRLKQLELELEVLTLAARHHVPWIVGFFGAEKRGHSVLMYLEYCRHGSLLDYMVEGNSADAAVWSPSAAPDGAAPQLLTGHAGGSSGRSFDANGSPPVAAVETRGRNADTMNNAANSLITNSPLQGLREVCKRHTQPAAAPTLNCQEQQRRQQQQQTTDVGSTTTGEVQREETEAAATSGHASPHVCTRQEESVEGEEYAAHRGEAGLAVAAASVSSSASSVVFSGSALDTMPLSEALNPQMPPLSIEQAQRFAKQIVEGLCFLHQHNYAHLDVKTANVLVAADEECRLADLGCAMRLQPPPPASLWQQQGGPAGTGNPVKEGPDGDLDDALSPPPYPVLVDRDAITELRGTALYMAPEMIRFESHVIGSPADVWSLGCVVMEMTTGCAPWRHISKDKLRVLYRIGSARDELPLPPLIHAWAEKAREWLAQERLSATAAAVPAAEQQDVVEACAMEADDVAQAPCSCSATKMYPAASDVDRSDDVVCGNRDKAASDKLGEPCSRRRRLEQGASGSDSSSMAVDRAGKQGPPAFSVVDTSRSSCEDNVPQRAWSSLAPEMPAALSTLTTSARASASSLSFARVVSAPTAGPLIDQTKGDDENAAAVEAEERLFRGQSRVMRLYVALEDFVAACVKLRPEDRSSAAELLRHPFLTLCKDDV